MIDEGTIKYRCDWERIDVIRPEEIAELTRYRDALHRLNLIGQYPNGIGFGNLSRRDVWSDLWDGGLLGVLGGRTAVRPYGGDVDGHSFIVTGTQTAHLSTLTVADYAKVTAFNPSQNTLACQGLCKASSESLTHGVIYAQDPNINAIIHIHHRALWQQSLHKLPTTRADIPYGTPEMAAETQRLFQETNLPDTRIFAMAGHEEGIVAFGETLETAYRTLVNCGIAAQILPASAKQLPT